MVYITKVFIPCFRIFKTFIAHKTMIISIFEMLSLVPFQCLSLIETKTTDAAFVASFACVSGMVSIPRAYAWKLFLTISTAIKS